MNSAEDGKKSKALILEAGFELNWIYLHSINPKQVNFGYRTSQKNTSKEYMLVQKFSLK
jgi:hypothetical protein